MCALIPILHISWTTFGDHPKKPISKAIGIYVCVNCYNCANSLLPDIITIELSAKPRFVIPMVSIAFVSHSKS